MGKKQKIVWSLACLATLLLTLLPFFQVGLTNPDDFQYFNTSHYPGQWVYDATIYAHGAGRFFFLLTKYFYYVPYLGDNYALTKFIQYFTVACSYALFSFLVYKVFRSKRLAALTGLLLVFNMSLSTDIFPPTSYPFYFHFSLIVFLTALLSYVNYDEKGGYWRVVVGAVLALVSCLFYENYVLFSGFFIVFVFVREWNRNGFAALWKTKEFYKRVCPFIVALAVYMACYVGYRSYLTSHFEDAVNYGGSILSSHINWSNFFDILATFTIYTLPGKIAISQNGNVWFALTHASTAAYINALIQCGLLWFLMKKADFKNMAWSRIIIGFLVAVFVAFASHTLIAVSEKYNAHLFQMRLYVTSMYSFFTVALALALLIVLSVKLIHDERVRSAVVVVWCLLMAVFSINISYNNEVQGKEWKKSQNRITLMELVAKEHYFDKIPEQSVLYIESLLHTSPLAWSVCYESYDFQIFIGRVSGKKYVYAVSWEDLQNEMSLHPESEVYFLQAAESRNFDEMMFAFSHISRMGDQLSSSVADAADVFYYSPTKKFTLFYGIPDAIGGVSYKALKMNSEDINHKFTHISICNECLYPLEFRVSNME